MPYSTSYGSHGESASEIVENDIRAESIDAVSDAAPLRQTELSPFNHCIDQKWGKAIEGLIEKDLPWIPRMIAV